MSTAKPSGDAPGRDDPHRLGGELVDLLGHRDDVLVVRQDHDLVGRHRLDRFEQLRGRRVHRLPAGHDRLHAERVVDAAHAFAGGDGHHGGTGSWMCGGSSVASPSRTQRSSSTCSMRSVTRILRGRPQSSGASMAAPMSSVWMWQFHSPSPPTTTIESPMPDHTSLNAGMAASFGFEEVHDLVAEVAHRVHLALGRSGLRTDRSRRGLRRRRRRQAVEHVRPRVEEQHEASAPGVHHAGLRQHRQLRRRLGEGLGGGFPGHVHDADERGARLARRHLRRLRRIGRPSGSSPRPGA